MKNIWQIDYGHNRIYGLDILRALAILFVVIGHGNLILLGKFKTVASVVVFDGVSIFFVLSGFLIGGILIKVLEKSGISRPVIFNFWIRRWFRTLPNYLLILTLLTVLNLFFVSEFTFSSIYKYYIFSQNLFTKHPDFFFQEAWSLSIEEWFYLLIPIIVLLVNFTFKLSIKKTILYTAIGVLLAITLFRLYRYSIVSVENLKEWDLVYRKQVFTRLDSLMYGVIGAYLQYYFEAFWYKYKKYLLVIGIFIFFLTKLLLGLRLQGLGLYFCVFSFSITSLATLFLLPYLSQLNSGKGLFYKIFTHISLISYSMYLLNLSVIQKWMINKIEWENYIFNNDLISLIKYVIYWVLTIVLSTLLFKYFEIPFTKLRDKIKFKSKGMKGKQLEPEITK